MKMFLYDIKKITSEFEKVINSNLTIRSFIVGQFEIFVKKEEDQKDGALWYITDIRDLNKKSEVLYR